VNQSSMPVWHAEMRPLFVANARHIPDMAALCASIERISARLPGTAD